MQLSGDAREVEEKDIAEENNASVEDVEFTARRQSKKKMLF